MSALTPVLTTLIALGIAQPLPKPKGDRRAKPKVADQNTSRELIDRIVAIVNDEVITFSEIKDAAAPLIDEAGGASKRDALYKQILDQLIGEKLLTQQVRELLHPPHPVALRGALQLCLCLGHHPRIQQLPQLVPQEPAHLPGLAPFSSRPAASARASSHRSKAATASGLRSHASSPAIPRGPPTLTESPRPRRTLKASKSVRSSPR